MMITAEIWKVLSTEIASTRTCPSWLKKQGRLDWESLSKLPVVEATSAGQDALPTIEITVVTADYLDFLREQVRLNPRGPEWLALIKSRLSALEPFVDKQLMVATFYCKPHVAIFRIRPDVEDVIHVEMDT
jgi:hypothetical protein